MGVAIFAVPAGLIGSGLTDAMDEEKHEKELDEYRARMRKSFRRTVDKTLRGYLNTLPDGGGEKLKALNFVPQRIPLSRIQIRQGIEMKDIFDICQKYPEFRLKNLAEAISDEEHPQDSFVVEHFPKNRPYGYAIDRKSKVTIVSTSSFSDNGTGWFTYYLAKLGGFNYISKDIEVDPDELDSFYNMSAESLYEKRPRSEYDEKKDKKAIEILNKKDANRQDFLDDLRDMATGEDSWVILFVAHIKSSMNTVDFHFASAKKDGSDSTVHQQEVYQALLEQLTDTLQKDYALTSDLHSQRFPLTKNNLGYRLQQKGIVCNAFVIRPSCEVINFDNRRLLIAYRIATVISRQLDGGRGIQPDDVKDFKETGFGYGLA
jgi:voltage-gated potassium channel